MKRYFLAATVFLLAACGGENDSADAYGNFEATEVILSAELSGLITNFNVSEGQSVQAGVALGQIDTTQLHLQRRQVEASIKALSSKYQDIEVQEKVYEEQRKNLKREIARFKKLVQDGAATQKQLDDLKGQLELVESQRAAQLSALRTSNAGLAAEEAPLKAKIDQIEDQIKRSRLASPIDGVILNTYAEPGEMAVFGKPLLRIADLRNMELRVYVSGSQLASIETGQEVTVLYDGPEGKLANTTGRITWIADEAEFTPKTIQTREERVNLVYALKVMVPNDGQLKIGMPGEIKF